MPRNVALFELCAYVALGFGVFTFPFVIGAITVDPAIAQLGSSSTVLLLAVLSGVAASVIYGLLIWAAARKRQGWARIVYALFTVLGLITTAFQPQSLQLLGWFSIGSFAIQTLLQLAAIFYVFKGEANGWFDKSQPVQNA